MKISFVLGFLYYVLLIINFYPFFSNVMTKVKRGHFIRKIKMPQVHGQSTPFCCVVCAPQA